MSDLFHVRLGAGRPVLLMHGGLGFDHSYFRPYLDPLARKAELIFYDHRGNGRSPVPMDPTVLDFARWCDDAEDLRLALGLGPIILLGHSYGSFIAQEFALRYPASVAGLILSNTAPAFDYPDVLAKNVERRVGMERVGEVLQTLGTPATSDAHLREIWRRIAPLYFHRFDPEVLRVMDETTTYRATAFNVGMRLLVTFSTLLRLPQLQVPVLLLGGAHDWVTPLDEGALRFRQRVPHADLEVFERSGHYPFIEERDRYLSVVGDWIARLPA